MLKNIIFLWLGCLLGAISILPYLYYLKIIPPSTPFNTLFLLSLIQAALLYGIILWLSYILIPKTDLKPFNTEKLLNQIVLPGIFVGLFSGLTILVLNKIIFQNSILNVLSPPFWIVILASLYGAINEEVLLRLFLFTLIYFLFNKLNWKCSVIFWITNILVALIFGLSHLPAAFKITPLSSFEIFRILLLNGIPGIAFGYLYASRGIYAAALAHFTADIVIHTLI